MERATVVWEAGERARLASIPRALRGPRTPRPDIVCLPRLPTPLEVPSAMRSIAIDYHGVLDFPWVTEHNELIKFGDVCPPSVVRLWLALRRHGYIPYILSFMGQGRDEGGPFRERAWLFRQSLADQLAPRGYQTSYADTVDQKRVFLKIRRTFFKILRL